MDEMDSFMLGIKIKVEELTEGCQQKRMRNGFQKCSSRTTEGKMLRR
jgi:hypothetical protein